MIAQYRQAAKNDRQPHEPCKAAVNLQGENRRLLEIRRGGPALPVFRVPNRP